MTTPFLHVPCNSVAPGHCLHFQQVRRARQRLFDSPPVVAHVAEVSGNDVVLMTSDGVRTVRHHDAQLVRRLAAGHVVGLGPHSTLVLPGRDDRWETSALLSVATVGQQTDCRHSCAAAGDTRELPGKA